MLTKNKITKITNKFVAFLMFATLFCFAAGAGISAVHAISHHGPISHAAKDFHNCTICSFSNLQNQTLATADLFFVTSAFLLIFALRNFKRVKLSYLLTSSYCRAPPKRS